MNEKMSVSMEKTAGILDLFQECKEISGEIAGAAEYIHDRLLPAEGVDSCDKAKEPSCFLEDLRAYRNHLHDIMAVLQDVKSQL